MRTKLTRIKRKRGGQQGNQNARKHGFYSSALSPPDEMCRLQDIIVQERIDPEMAVLRVKLQSLISQSPVSPHVLREVARLIVKWSAKKYRKAIGREVLYFGRLTSK